MNSFSMKYPCLVFKFKVFFFIFADSFQNTVSLPTAGRNTVFGIEYFLFFVVCFDNSVGWSPEEFKFCDQFLA